MTDYAIWTPKFDGDAPPNWKAGMKSENSKSGSDLWTEAPPCWDETYVYRVPPEALDMPFDYPTWAAQGRANADKLPDGVAEALGPERDWADEISDGYWSQDADKQMPLADLLRSRCRPINDTVTDERYRHKARGTEYTLIGVGRVQGTLHDEDPVVLYRGDDGGLWVRHQVEFSDGRFERVNEATP